MGNLEGERREVELAHLPRLIVGSRRSNVSVQRFAQTLDRCSEGWVALSKSEDKVLAHAAELQDAIQKAKEAGESDP